MKLLQLLEENKNNDMFICREGFEGYNFFVPKKDKSFIYVVDKDGKYLMTDSGCHVMWNPTKENLLADDWKVFEYSRPNGEADYTTLEGYVVTTEQYSLIKTQKAINDTLNKLLDKMSEGVVHTNQGEWHTARTVSSPAREMATTQAQKSLDMLSNTVSKFKDEYREFQEHQEEQDTSYIDRMTKERDELIDKYHKLSHYLVNHKEELSKEEIRLMDDQYRIMFRYSEILYERIGIALNKKI